MGQSLVQNYVHIVFSTKYREPLIHPSFEKELYEYIAGICLSLECYPKAIGGYLDHLHILCHLSKKIAMMDLLRIIKANSSRWVNLKHPQFKKFRWQNGYGAFGVNKSGLKGLVRYIENQHQHHFHEGFKEEYRSFLEKHKVDFDEQYIWD